jgi:gamma-glutamylputrescine oxidase
MAPRAHPDSYYAATAELPPARPPLEDHQVCEVCVIGGGFTGVSCALHLAERGYDVALLESERIGWGASGRNGGQLGSGQRKGQDELEKMLGREHAHRLWALAEESKATARHLIHKHAIRCDLKSGVLHPMHRADYVDDAHRYVRKLRRDYGYDQIEAVSTREMADMLGTDAYHGGWLDTGAGHLHPLNYVLGLARAAAEKGVRIYEGSRVSRYDASGRVTVHTAGGTVRADRLVIGCNGYLAGLEPKMSGKIMPINNFILATEPLGEARARRLIRDDVAVADSRFVVNYYRLSADRRLLFGGGENYTRRFPADIGSFVRRYMLKIYPDLRDVRIEFAWGGTLAVTLNRMPHFGRLGDTVYFAQGYSGHGVAMATLAGKVVAEAIDGDSGKFDTFAGVPTPTFPGGRYLRWPAQVMGMLYYSMRDRL